MVPRVVFDPDEGDVPEVAVSEVPRSIRFQRRAAADPGRLPATRTTAPLNADRLKAIHGMHERGDVEIVDLEADGVELFVRLTTSTVRGVSGCTSQSSQARQPASRSP